MTKLIALNGRVCTGLQPLKYILQRWDHSCVLERMEGIPALESLAEIWVPSSPWVWLALQCVMHLEDRLQEMYLKSKMLSEYLRGHTRVHVKELSVVLGWVQWRTTVAPRLYPLTRPAPAAPRGHQSFTPRNRLSNLSAGGPGSAFPPELFYPWKWST